MPYACLYEYVDSGFDMVILHVVCVYIYRKQLYFMSFIIECHINKK